METIVTKAIIHQLIERDKEHQFTKCGLTLDIELGVNITTGWQSHVTCEDCLSVDKILCKWCDDTGVVRGCPYCIGPEADYHTMCLDDEDIPCDACT